METENHQLKKRRLTPMLEQYMSVKEKHTDKLLLFRMGDFYEIFFEDAAIAARTLKITLTSRNKKSENAVPMCGFPHHAATGYIATLVQAGHKVVVCDQVEDPKLAKGLVRREVTKIITPGVNLESDSLTPDKDNFLAAISHSIQKKELFGLALLDVSTGKFRVTELTDLETLLDELGRCEPTEILLPPARTGQDQEWQKEIQQQFVKAHFTLRPESDSFSPEPGRKLLCQHFGTLNLDGFGGQHLAGPGAGAAGAALAYAMETQTNTKLNHIQGITIYRPCNFMQIDRNVIFNLELLCTIQEQSKQGSLLGVLDRCRTSMGSRQLKEWLLFPLLDKELIEQRLDAVQTLLEEKRSRVQLQTLLKKLYDLDRLAGRLAAAKATGRDLLSLKDSLGLIPEIKELLSNLPLQPTLINQALQELHELRELTEKIKRFLLPEQPISITEGKLINNGIDENLDELRLISKSGKQWLIEYEQREKARTGINGLKVRYNRVFGYYIEVTKRNFEQVPEDYQRRQTLTNADRFITPELKEYEEKILGAEEKINTLELEIFLSLRREAAQEIGRIRESALRLTLFDVLSSLAEVADEQHYCRPEIISNRQLLEIEDGRHPVIESLSENFVPNNTSLNREDEQLWIITGPNMAGKSTFLRQNGLFVLMAQMGGFVPAKAAKISIFDHVFTRVGASDNLSRGLSTFMVEMTETARILNQATANSLIILDEIGRGTSTFDGLSLAWAIAEEIHERIGSLTLFATHYHELCELELIKNRIKNYNVAVQQRDDGITFLRRINKGSTNHSYGIEVAKLAGIPHPVLAKAREILTNLEAAEIAVGGNLRVTGKSVLTQQTSGQQSGYLPFLEPPPATRNNPVESKVVELIKKQSLNRTTPIKALTILDKLQKMLAD
ncbi:MAG: DNA mismatch repair protein MutS [Deltaproteobacteria bacterium]|nr:DNA mismatch repair protein MutS [Candidatus Tharpella sp.]